MHRSCRQSPASAGVDAYTLKGLRCNFATTQLLHQQAQHVRQQVIDVGFTCSAALLTAGSDARTRRHCARVAVDADQHAVLLSVDDVSEHSSSDAVGRVPLISALRTATATVS